MILGKIEILEGDWSREGVLSDRNILVWSCRVVVTAFQSLDSITQWNNLIWTWCLLNFKQLLADNFKGVVTWKLTLVLLKHFTSAPKNITSKVNGHAPMKISCSKGDGLSVRCIRSTVGYLFWELNVHGHFTKSSSLRKSPLNENFPVLRTVYFASRTEIRLLTMKNIVSRQFQFFLNNREQFVEYGVSVCRNYK